MARLGLASLLTVWILAMAGAAAAESIPLRESNGNHFVSVQINDKLELDFMLDSGATDVTIPLDVFSTLIRTGTIREEDALGEQVYRLADGSEQKTMRYTLQSLRVGSLEAKNVVAAVGPEHGLLLLGQSFLRKFRSWSVDNQSQSLILAGGSRITEPPSDIAQESKDGLAFLGRTYLLGKYPGPLEYVDTTRIWDEGNLKYAWFKKVSPGLRNRDPHLSTKYWLELEEFDCSRRTARMLMTTSERFDGTRETFGQETYSSPLKPVVPNTMLERRLKFVCQWK